MDAVVVADLRKSYGATRAVAGVSFTVRYGEIFSLLGPNGAGKTTVLEILEGYRHADEGKVVVAGLDPGDRRTGRQLREQIGLVLQERGGAEPPPRSADVTWLARGSASPSPGVFRVGPSGPGRRRRERPAGR